MKEDCLPSSHVPISDSKSIQKSELLGLLKTYNCYHEGKSFQLRHREEEGTLIIEGLLNIAWGLRRPIRLQMQDDREQVHLPSTSWMPRRPSCPLHLSPAVVCFQKGAIAPEREHHSPGAKHSASAQG